ncbi:ABC protein [Flagelloscypha sp. PMI_526]|nr:ABC protein [Flagelloscypha sp. PMI_526]
MKPMELEEKRVNEQSRPTKVQELDFGQVRIRKREHWWQIWVPSGEPPPPPQSLEDAHISPLVNASILSKFSYTWINDLMVLGYWRTLQASDLPKLNDQRLGGYLSEQMDAAWAKRVTKAEEWNAKLQSGKIAPSFSLQLRWFARSVFRGGSSRRKELEETWRSSSGLKEPSLVWTLNDVLGRNFWLGGLCKTLADLSQLAIPILLREIVNFAKKRAGGEEENIGRGVGLALGLFLCTVGWSVLQNQAIWLTMVSGILARAGLISSIFKRGVSLSGKSRTTLPNSVLVTHLGADISRVENAALWILSLWTVPIQLSVCLILLGVQLGPSALVGFTLFLLLFPLQAQAMKYTLKTRKQSVKFTDARSSILLEVFSSMRIIKFFTYENSFLKRIAAIRRSELRGVRRIQNALSFNMAFAFSTPALATTVSLVTYVAITDTPDVAVIFASVSLFALLRQPMMFLPRGLSSSADARSALQRLTKVFHAELLTETLVVVDTELDVAIKVERASFTWDAPPPLPEAPLPKKGSKAAKVPPPQVKDVDPAFIFEVKNISMSLGRGKLAAVIGRVGSGKSSLLSGLLGEMRRTEGQVTFGGKIAYCAQTAWIQNGTLRENILFGLPYDEDRYWSAIESACLIPDLEQLPDGDLTEIGEKGINLSGGQKQRVNICRALYANADVYLLDDPLSAVDSHVGKSLFSALAALRDRGTTVILVTHALHFLSQCDYIYAVTNGRIAEAGTYAELVAAGGETGALIKEFGGKEGDADVSGTAGTSGAVDAVKKKSAERSARGTGRLEGKLIVKETRETGSVSWIVYATYFKAARGWITLPIVFLAAVTFQAASLLSNITITWWSQDPFNWPFWKYEVLFATLGVGQMFLALGLCIAIDVSCELASRNVHRMSVEHIFRAPMAFFDTTPTGRIMSVFGKDVDIMDNQLSISLRMFVMTLAGLIGSAILITIYEHYFIVVAVGIMILYRYFGAYYQASAREMKRLDAMLRSLLYAHFSESLTGLPTIRSYKAVDRFISDNKYYIDLENRALILTIANQRWLSVRVDVLGSLMVFFVAIMAVTGVTNASAAEVGLILTYVTQLTQASGTMTRQSAETENYMNSVERLVHYSRDDAVPSEAPYEKPDSKPPPEWPSKGNIEFQDVEMRYRPGLPTVLKGISVSIQGGQRIGICGRTGSGKSSLTLSLLRIVEYSGLITIDGVDISKLGLFDLRSRISIIPQEPILFSGTVRDSLDPFSNHDDATLWSALRRAHITSSTDGHGTDGSRITLDTQIETDGANLSVGERSLLSIARALVKDARIVILDEATASVDLETDKKIQETISQFHGKTLLCIAHRLRTILNYDRILVLDEGEVAEFDTPMNLFNRTDGVFRSLCEKSDISLRDLQAASADRDPELRH